MSNSSSVSSEANAKRFARPAWMVLAFLTVLLAPHSAAAHPMGNFSVSHYAGIHIDRDTIELKYLIDMAEIPTFQEMQQTGISAAAGDPNLAGYLDAKAREFQHGLAVELNGRLLELHMVSQNVIFPPGAGNLPTMKFGFIYRAPMPDSCRASNCEVVYSDTNFADRSGWKEIVVSVGPGVALVNSNASALDRSMQLVNYPTDLLNSPPQDLSARIVFSNELRFTQSARGGEPKITTPLKPVPQITAARMGPAATPSVPKQPHDQKAPEILSLTPNRQGTPRNAFTELIAKQQIGFWFALLAALIAAGLGALHALEPGHGKTIVAAYLVGSKGTIRQAILLGLIVTVTHTAGVYMLGAATLYAQRYILPEKLYPLLGVLSGLLIAGMGVYLLLSRFLGTEFGHQHGPGGHDHGSFWKSKESDSTVPKDSLNFERQAGSRVTLTQKTAGRDEKVSIRSLLLLGISGGIVPCPAAIVVLLSAVALHRVGFGLFLIVWFSIGLAAVLIGMGLVAVCARRLMSRLPTEGPLIQRWLPMTSAAMITALGCVVACRGLVAAGILPTWIQL